MRYVSFGGAAVVLAAFLWSLDGLLRRQLYSLPPTVVVFWEHVLGFIILLPVIALTFRGFRRFTRRQWLSILLVALLSGALGTYFYTAALAKIQYIQFSVVVLLQQLQPLFAIGAAALLLREPLSRRFLALALIALLAAYGVSFPHLRVTFATGDGTLLAALLALGAAFCWGASTAFSKYTLRGTSFLHVTAIRFGLTPVFALLLTYFLGAQEKLNAVSAVQWQYLVGITLSTGLVALAIYYFGLQRVPASRSTLLELTWPVSAVFLGYLFFHERLTVSQWVSAVVLIGVMVLVARDAERLAQQRSASERLAP